MRYDAAERGPAFGAARLARLCATGESVRDLLVAPAILSLIEPDTRLTELYQPRLAGFRAVYGALRPLFQPDTPAERADVAPQNTRVL